MKDESAIDGRLPSLTLHPSRRPRASVRAPPRSAMDANTGPRLMDFPEHASDEAIVDFPGAGGKARANPLCLSRPIPTVGMTSEAAVARQRHSLKPYETVAQRFLT